MTGNGLPVALALLLLGACAQPPLPPGQPRPRGSPPPPNAAFLPNAPVPGDYNYDAYACGVDHGMIEELVDDARGRLRIGPPEMSICK